jgi:hypothetical protein
MDNDLHGNEWEKESISEEQLNNMLQHPKLNVDPSFFGQALTLARSKYS